jgi:hypothetical protein
MSEDQVSRERDSQAPAVAPLKASPSKSSLFLKEI